MTKKIKELEERIVTANKAYREGSPIMSDPSYDNLIETLEELDPENEILKKIGNEEINLDPTRKEKLPIKMASMNKVKTVQSNKKNNSIEDWIRLKGISQDTEFILTPKYDGLSILTKENKHSAWTRGNGVVGQNSDNHIKKVIGGYNSDVEDLTWGEVIMKKSVFLEKYKDDFSNPRNLVSGLLNKKEVSEPLQDCNYIRYGIKSEKFKTKEEELDFLNSFQKESVPYKKVILSQINEEYLLKLFKKWSEEFEIDGIIVEVNSNELKKFLGRETSTNNPCWARAYKGDFEEVKESKVLEIKWNISKQGYLKPVLYIEPVDLDGAIVRKVTGNNARYIKEMKIGVGSIVKVKRSGMVIPFIVENLVEKEFEMPFNENIIWVNNVELKMTILTDEQKVKQLISFFKILNVSNFSEGLIRQLYNHNYDTVKKILRMKKIDFEKLPRFGERKAEKVYNSIKDSMNSVELSKLQHASGFFENLGSKKLKKLESLTKENRNIEYIKSIDDFAEKSAKSYLNGIDKFEDFFEEIKDYVKIKENVKKSDSLKDKNFVFSGIRRKDLNEIIETNGGHVKTSVSSKTSFLVVKEKGSGSGKEKKAIKNGVDILTIDEMEEMLKKLK